MFDEFIWDESFHLGKSAINSVTINLNIQYPPISTSAMPWRTLPFPICWPTVSKWNAETFFVLYMHVRHRKYHHSKLSQHHSDYPIACVMLCLCYVWGSKLSAITCSKLYLQSLTYSYRQAVLSTFHWPDPFPEMANIFLPNRDPFGFLCLGHLAPWCDRMWVCFMLVGVHGLSGLCAHTGCEHPGVMSNDGCYTNLWSLFGYPILIARIQTTNYFVSTWANC